MDTKRIGGPGELPPIATLAKWVVTRAAPLPYGTLLDYATLSEIVALPAQGRRGRAAILKAQTMLLKEHNKFLRCVIGKGYEICNPDEVPESLKSYRRASLRRLRKAQLVGAHTVLADVKDEKNRTALIIEQTKAGILVSMALRVGAKRKLETLRSVLLPTGKQLAKAIAEKVG